MDVKLPDLGDSPPSNYAASSSPTTDRKRKKPMMEKKRRKRFNDSLVDLKHILQLFLRNDPNQVTKFEKADVLEMVVSIIRQHQKIQMAKDAAVDPSVLVQFRTGWFDCIAAVKNFVEAKSTDFDPDLAAMLVAHVHDHFATQRQLLHQQLTPPQDAASIASAFYPVRRNDDANQRVPPTIGSGIFPGSSVVFNTAWLGADVLSRHHTLLTDNEDSNGSKHAKLDSNSTDATNKSALVWRPF